MQVKDVMQTDVVTVADSAPVKDAYDLMKLNGFRHIPVVDDHGAVAGIVSDRDILNVVVVLDKNSEQVDANMIGASTPVGDVMTTELMMASPELDLRVVIDDMLAGRFNCFPVAEDDKLVGIVTHTDLLRALSSLLDKV